MTIKLLTGHNLDFTGLKGGCTGSYEFTLVNMPHCWEYQVMLYICIGPRVVS